MECEAIILLVLESVEDLVETSDESSDEELEICSIHDDRQCRIPRHRIQNYMETLSLYSDAEFKTHFRMRRDTFKHLLQLIEPKLLRKSRRFGRRPISPEKQLAIAIWTMATPDSYRSLCDRFDVGKATAWRAVRRVSSALYALTPHYITWPTRDEAVSTMVESRYGFPKVIGAIDGTHISISAPKDHAEAYINRKGYHSIQLQVVCNSELQFIHCYTGQVGSVHDMRVFRLSGLQNRFTPQNFPMDGHLLGDGGYGIHKYIMVPYRDNGHLSDVDTNFNTRLSSARMMVERFIGLLKGRFRSLLDNLPMKRTELIPQYIIACCVLHNICIQRNNLIEVPIIVHHRNVNIQHSDRNVDNFRQEGIEKRIAITYALRELM